MREPGGPTRRSGAMEAHVAFVIRVVVALSLIVAVVACGGSAPSSSPDPAVPGSLAGTAWRVASIDGQNAVPNHEPTVIFDGTRVEGTGGCNGYGGDYTFDADSATLTVGDLMSTMMGCMGPEGDYEGRFHQAFHGPLKVSILGEQLTLQGPAGTIVLDGSVRDNTGG